jgi:hypothetical protein
MLDCDQVYAYHCRDVLVCFLYKNQKRGCIGGDGGRGTVSVYLDTSRMMHQVHCARSSPCWSIRSDIAMIKLACWLVYPVVLPEQKFELQNLKVTVW